MIERTDRARPERCRRRWAGGLAVLLSGAMLAACSETGGDAGAGSGGTGNADSPTAAASTVETLSTPSPSPAAEVGPFTGADLEGLVLAPEEGKGLVRGLSYASTYSGTAGLGDVHHWTLVPTERLEEAGFVEAYSAMFMTPAFPATFATEGRDLATAALLFAGPAGAREALRVFADTRDEVWAEWRPLPTRGGIATAGFLGSDNVSVVYPTVGFMSRVANVIVMVGSQGGSDEGRPLPTDLASRVSSDLRTRARSLLATLSDAEG